MNSNDHNKWAWQLHCGYLTLLLLAWAALHMSGTMAIRHNILQDFWPNAALTAVKTNILGRLAQQDPQNKLAK